MWKISTAPRVTRYNDLKFFFFDASWFNNIIKSASSIFKKHAMKHGWKKYDNREIHNYVLVKT